MRAYLIIQSLSYEHVRNIAHFIHRRLQVCFGEDACLVRTDEIDAVDYDENAVVLVIGERFRRHTRRPSCLYVYLNFSVLAFMGNPWKSSPEGVRAILRKRRLLFEKVDLYDAVLDYFPPQTERLRKSLPQPVLGFPVAIDQQELTPPAGIAERALDLCFVGGSSPRRKTVLKAIDRLALQRSPGSGVVFEDMAASSKLCLNIHSVRSNHLETPRIIGAIASGCPVLTEPCYGLETLVPLELVETASPRRMAQRARALLEDQEALQTMQDRAFHWHWSRYHPQAILKWEQLLDQIRDLPR